MTRFAGHTYKLIIRAGYITHDWSLRGPDGGLNFHFSEWKDREKDAKYGVSAGLEVHRLQPPEYQRGDAPHHAPCWLLGAPCWHDGTSLYATETLLPVVQTWLRHGDHLQIFSLLEQEYLERFESS